MTKAPGEGSREAASAGPPRLLEILEKAEGYLAQKGCATARLDAQLLLAHVLQCERIRLYVDYEKPLAEAELDAYRELIRRRAAAEPTAYLLGDREFWSLSFRVDPRVLIPRPDSETLIEEARDLFSESPPGCFADVGTGSGCLAAALATEFSQAQGVAVDVQPEAVALARDNLQRLALADRVSVRQGHLTAPLDGPVDLLVANLPYIPSGDLAGLPKDVRAYEPCTALDGGADGLDLIRLLVGEAPARLRPDGWLLLEVGQGQAAAVVELCVEVGLGSVHTRPDLGGVIRVVAAQRVTAATNPGPGDGQLEE